MTGARQPGERVDDQDPPVPVGVCTAPGCHCSNFTPRAKSLMYCAQVLERQAGKKGKTEEAVCGHSVEWHNMAAKAV